MGPYYLFQNPEANGKMIFNGTTSIWPIWFASKYNLGHAFMIQGLFWFKFTIEFDLTYSANSNSLYLHIKWNI